MQAFEGNRSEVGCTYGILPPPGRRSSRISEAGESGLEAPIARNHFQAPASLPFGDPDVSLLMDSTVIDSAAVWTDRENIVEGLRG